MHRYLLVVLSTLIVSCATTAGYEKVLNSWVGKQEVDLVRSWGEPIQSYEDGGHKFIVFSSERVKVVPTSGPPLWLVNVVKLSCTTTFKLDGSKVVSWTYEGNDCKE